MNPRQPDDDIEDEFWDVPDDNDELGIKFWMVPDFDCEEIDDEE